MNAGQARNSLSRLGEGEVDEGESRLSESCVLEDYRRHRVGLGSLVVIDFDVEELRAKCRVGWDLLAFIPMH